ncbi:MAG: diadenylate cyclase [Acidobacteriota bacterium]
MDISFRRSGALFVMLRRKTSLHELVRLGDGIRDNCQRSLDVAFDRALAPMKVQSLPRAVLSELASLDGAVVISNQGDVLAYGAILHPKKTGKVNRAEGSRSKAAIGASNYGLALKVSSDGDITVFVSGDELISV